MGQVKTIYVIHSSNVSLDTLNELFNRYIPEARVFNIVDDSLLAGLHVHGHPTPEMLKRFCSYAIMAEHAGADMLFSQCSSFGGGVDIARRLINIPFLKIDQPMMEQAVKCAGKIAIVATVKSTMKPSADLLRECAAAAGKQVEITEVLAENALKVLMEEGDPDKHDREVLELIQNLPDDVECVVLAQGSMYRLKDRLKDFKIPVLASPELGVIAARGALRLD